jgi:cytoskeletal protein CcmA (bactofilin family)
MFRRRNPETEPAPAREPFTYIHQDTVLTGELVAKGRVRVHGKVRGNVRVTGVLEVAESGTVEAERLEADEVKIIGLVRAGQLVVSGKVEIWKGGELVGDVKAAALDIEDGARFTGRSEMTGDAGAGAAPESGGRRREATTAPPRADEPPAGPVDEPEAPARTAQPVGELESS